MWCVGFTGMPHVIKIQVTSNQTNLTEIKGIVNFCPACQHTGFGLGVGVNPRGILPLQLCERMSLMFQNLDAKNTLMSLSTLFPWQFGLPHKLEKLLTML